MIVNTAKPDRERGVAAYRSALVPLVTLILIASLTASCGLLRRDGSGRTYSERTLPFKAKLSKQDDPREFAVSVANRGHGVDDVRESVRYRATRYCLYAFGGSDTAWAMDPASADWAYVQDGDSLIFSGRCTKR